jgi:hypothetical protein
MIYILTLANKPRYLPEAIASIKAQTRSSDLEHIVVLDQGEDWGGGYPPAVFYNEWAKKLPFGSYISWLSDDDMLLPRYVEVLAGFLDDHREIDCCYGGSEVLFEEGAGIRSHSWAWLPKDPLLLFQEGWPIFDGQTQPGCVIDGGQFMVRRTALEKIEYPYMNEDPAPWAARLTDAHVMNKLANAVGIHPVPIQVMINRITPLSAHCRPGPNGQREIVDWRMAPKWES